jgi:hypothetical protein
VVKEDFNMSFWIARAFQGSYEDIQGARAELQAALEDGVYTSHQIDLVRPAFNEPPAEPATMVEGEYIFGFAIAEGTDYPIPEGCREVNPRIAAIVLGIGGIVAPGPTGDPTTP